ncbi:FAST kinase domain-containing protein 4-like [Homarus americanus]|uniref:FAST kinase domain-containing protein 4-like n=1 Tax=Homarus americanus TaxID=6706 RepID=A0A8J5JYU1_HOMAM|nr:FAST kinase domain-containing protein 4-like [Homarus americanus]
MWSGGSMSEGSQVQSPVESPELCTSLLIVLHLSVATATTTTSNWRPLENQDEEVSSSSVIKAKDVPVLLQAATNGGSLSSAFQGLQTLSDWVSNKKIDFKKDVENEEQFTNLQNLMSDLVKSKTSQYEVKDNKNYTISSPPQSIENQLLWNIRKVSFSMLVSIMVFQVQHQNTELQKKVLKESLEAIQRRWVEIRAAPEIEAFYNHQDLYTSEFLGHVDDRTIELASEMNYVELSKIFCVLGTIKRRATPVIRALAFHMAKQVEKLTPKQLCNVLFAMNTLNFPDPVLLEKVAQDLVPQVTDIDKPKLVGSLLFCMGQMRWRHTSLLEVLSEWIEKNMQVCPMITLTAIINTLSTVSYMPSNSDSLFNVLVPKLIPSAFVKKTAWLDVVWSLCVLDRATEEHISSVLEPSFVSNIPSADQHLRMGIKLKLLNINAVAKLKMASYNGSYLDLANFKDVIITKGRDDLKLSKHIQIMLHNFLPPPRYIRENIQTTMGICVNAELLTDKKGKPLPIQDYSKSFGEYDNCKPLPEGAVKLALFVWGYRDYTIGSQELIGINKLAMQLLEKQDYKVVNIPFYEYNVKAKTLKNVQYLETKIKEAVES